MLKYILVCLQEKNVAVKSGSGGAQTRSRTAKTLRTLFKQLDHDPVAVQKELVLATPSNATAAARKPPSVAAAAIRAIKVPWATDSNNPKLISARRNVVKNVSRSGKQPATRFTGENQVVLGSCPSSDSSRNSIPFTLTRCKSLEKEVASRTVSQFQLQMEILASKLGGQHNEFQPKPSMVVPSAPEFVGTVQPSVVVPSAPEIVDKVQPSAVVDVSMDITRGCQQRTLEIQAEERRNNHGAHSFNLTELAGMMNPSCTDEEEVESSIDPSLFIVEGYLVKKEVAPLLQQIFDKHNDIDKDCTIKNRKYRVPYLEMIWYICQTLENASLKHITHDDLLDMLSAVGCLRNVGFNVKWISERINDIFTVKDILKNYLALKEENARKMESKQRELELLKQKFSATKAELVMIKAEVDEVNRKANEQIKGLMLKGLPSWEKSLLHGLI